MHTLIVAVAQGALFVLIAVAGVVWLALDRSGKFRMGTEGAVGLALVAIGIWLAAYLHTDPRPFVSDPASTPLFAHAADNGFPSDHSAAAGLLTALVLRYRTVLGALVAAGAGLIAWARVSAHVHHVQDVLAGLAVGLTAGALAMWLAGLMLRALARGTGRRGSRAVRP